MKYKGQPIAKPKPRIIPILRDSTLGPKGEKIDNNIYLEANVVIDFSPFEDLCPLPDPPVIDNVPDYNDADYRLKIIERNEKKIDWVFLESIKETKDLEWETVKMEDPETWANYHDELRKIGINEIQEKAITQQVLNVNVMDEERMEEARDSFLALQEKVQEK